MTTETLERTDAEVDLSPVEPGDHEKFRHYAPKAAIAESAVTGLPIRAICGKFWTPTSEGRGLPICPDCVYLFEHRSDGSERP